MILIFNILDPWTRALADRTTQIPVLAFLNGTRKVYLPTVRAAQSIWMGLHTWNSGCFLGIPPLLPECLASRVSQSQNTHWETLLPFFPIRFKQETLALSAKVDPGPFHCPQLSINHVTSLFCLSQSQSMDNNGVYPIPLLWGIRRLTWKSCLRWGWFALGTYKGTN